jgi:hypothetical protein
MYNRFRVKTIKTTVLYCILMQRFSTGGPQEGIRGSTERKGVIAKKVKFVVLDIFVIVIWG